MRTRTPGHLSTYSRLTDWEFQTALAKRTEEEMKIKDAVDQHATNLPLLKPGMRVRIQDPHSKKWNRSGKILGPRSNQRSYVVDIDGRTTIRNRRYLRPQNPRPSFPTIPKSSESDGSRSTRNPDATSSSKIAPRRSDRIKKRVTFAKSL